MSEKEVSAQQIVDKLNDIMEYNQDFGHQDITQAIKLFAKLIFNLQFDLDELKIHIIKMLKDLPGEGSAEYEELQYPDKKIATKPERLKNDFYS